MEGLDGHFFNGKLHYTILAAGITWAPGLTLPATPITGSSTRPTSFPLSRHDVVFTFSNIVCTYNVLRFTSCALNGPPLGIQDQSKNFHNITRLSFLRVYPFFFFDSRFSLSLASGPVCYHLRPSSHTCLNAAAWINPSISKRENIFRPSISDWSRVEPVRQKMAGPIGHRREKEMKCEMWKIARGHIDAAEQS